MKATTATLAGSSLSQGKSLPSLLAELFKARLTLLVLVTTGVGFYLGADSVDYFILFHTLLGTGCVACGASALNQWLESGPDARMKRTEDRPIPSGRIKPLTVLRLGALLSCVGVLELALFVNLASAFLAAITLVSYVAIYTPLKRVSWLNTLVGAVPGAIPPVIGWAAARDEVGLNAWPLFAILFFWQIPHFLAIAWIYREDYERGGFVMLPSVDPHGYWTGRQAVSHTFGLVLASLFPFAMRWVGVGYLVGALLLGLLFLVAAFRFSRDLQAASARALFYASILYLPLLLTLLVLDKRS